MRDMPLALAHPVMADRVAGVRFEQTVQVAVCAGLVLADAIKELRPLCGEAAEHTVTARHEIHQRLGGAIRCEQRRFGRLLGNDSLLLRNVLNDVLTLLRPELQRLELGLGDEGAGLPLLVIDGELLAALRLPCSQRARDLAEHG